MFRKKFDIKYLSFIYFILYSFISDCSINPISRANAPLPVSPTNNEVIYPLYGQKALSLKTNENIDFACPGNKVVLNTKTSTGSFVQATCVSGDRFKVSGQEYQFNQIHCSKTATAESRFTNRGCSGGKEAEIGFNLGNKFVRQILLCYDTAKQTTLYTQYEIVSVIGSSVGGTPRPSFEQDSGFFHIGSNTVNNLYQRGGQRNTINNLVGLNNADTKYIQNGQLYFLSRGHMAARTDFFYPAQQNATFKYINAAPQWQSFNGFNWNQAETDSRNYASSHRVSLQVYTGTYGIATLPHAQTKKDVELYLYANGNTRAIPVPALYWKIVYNPQTKKGIVLIGLNNPYETNVSKHVICPDVSKSVSWLHWNKMSIPYGYSYACSVPAFRNVVKFAPNIAVSGLLV